MRSRTNLRGAVEGSLVIFDTGYQGRVTAIEGNRVKVAIPLRSGHGIKLIVWLDCSTGMEYGYVRCREVLNFPARPLATKPFVENLIDQQKAINKALQEVKKLEVKDYIIQKIEKRKYIVCVETRKDKTIVEKSFKSITAAQEWCAIHLKKK